jgi:branched-subunit amino acid transport protein AzlD
MKIASLSGLLVALVGLGIIFIGVRELFYPAMCARQFGVPLLDPRDGDFLAIKAARDVVSGILALTFLCLRNRRFLTYAFGVLTLIPVFDGLIVLRHAGWTFTPALLIHWGTAAFMLVIVERLRGGK